MLINEGSKKVYGSLEMNDVQRELRRLNAFLGDESKPGGGVRSWYAMNVDITDSHDARAKRLYAGDIKTERAIGGIYDFMKNRANEAEIYELGRMVSKKLEPTPENIRDELYSRLEKSKNTADAIIAWQILARNCGEELPLLSNLPEREKKEAAKYLDNPAARQLFAEEKDRIDETYDGEHGALKYAMSVKSDGQKIAEHNKVILEDNLHRYFEALKRREKIAVLEDLLLAGGIHISEKIAPNVSKLYGEISELNESILEGIEEVNAYTADKSQKSILEEFKSRMAAVRKENKIRKLESATIPDVMAMISNQSSGDKWLAVKYLDDAATKKYLSDENIRIREKYIPYYESIADTLYNDGCGLAKDEKKIFEELLGKSFSALELAERTLAVNTALSVNGISVDEAIYRELDSIFRNISMLNKAADKELKKIITNSLLVSDEFVAMYPGQSRGVHVGLRMDKDALRQAFDSLLPDEREKVGKSLRKIPPELFGLYQDAVYMTDGLRMQFEHNVKSPGESSDLVGEENAGKTPNVGLDLLSSFRSPGWVSDAW